MVNLLIVESPGKIKKLKSILGSGWDVKASVGHIRQLANDGEAGLGFDLTETGVNCRYVPRDQRAQQTIAGLKSAARQASHIYIASDPDREGETIGWHIAQVLGLKNPQRVIYQEITETAVRTAMTHPRPLDMNLVGAGRCRDCLDKLVGYRGSPLVWRLNNGAKSVGRVQSATLHLVCAREREIRAFTPQDYWSVFVDYAEGLRAFYFGPVGGQPNSTPKDEGTDDAGATEPESTELGAAESLVESTRVLSQLAADSLVALAQAHPHQVQQIEGRQTSKKPPAPFITSTLQQAAGSRLKFSPQQTMQVAQKLYEAGLITYMRTDSVQLSPEFCAAVREWLRVHDPDNVPARVTKQKSAKGAQEAHEAIRPTDIHKPSAELKPQLSETEFKLYVLIWMRTVASQCQPARLRKTQIIITSGPVQWQARGQVVEFAGYARYWKDLSADTELPVLRQNQPLTLDQAGHEQKQTQPPPRYSEPKLVQLMERRGIGRPSTYAPTIATLKERTYLELIKGKLQPTQMGLEVDAFLAQALPDLLQTEFTAQMESALDAIAVGQRSWEQYLLDWNRTYFAPALTQALRALPAQTSALKAGIPPGKSLEKSRTRCPNCQQPLSKLPSKRLKKGYLLKCEQGCQGTDGSALVLFWSEREKRWQLPHPKAEPSAEPVQETRLTPYPCPVCGKFLEQYHYRKEGMEKAMLRCSDPQARAEKKHQDVAYFRSKEGK